ncbi:NACHT domain-containing protein [Patiriisocius sp. Uisw_017]|uniref:NACHT domain-containing protein n=1 Tax=Patiriisocius sp. Uisw_017 TaxID=3230968 RepID=UPI0039E7C53C
MDIETVKNIATVAAPLSKVVLETFLMPKFKEFRDKWKRENNLIDYAFENKFLEYLTSVYEKNGVLNTIAFKKKKVLLNDVYIPLTIQCEERHELPRKRKNLTLTEFDDELFAETNKILITDTAGMGKSTLSKKLLISAIEKNKGVPVLIELRRLSKEKDIIDEILEQLNPINEKVNRQFILDLIKRGDFIFFFDGFDEISLSDRSNVTKQIQTFITKSRKNKFVLTSRPEDALSSFGDFLKYQIKHLIPEEAYSLIKKYDAEGNIGDLLISKIKEPETFESIEEYLTTPLLVSLLFTAFEHKQRIPFKKHIFYRQVYDALFESHDLSKGDSFEREKHSKLGSDEFHRVLRIFGYLCLTNENKIEFTRDELGTIVSRAIGFCPEINSSSTNFIKDLLITVPLFAKDGIYYKWSHKSLQEYFAAQFIYLDSKEKQNNILTHVSFHPDNTSFINVIDLYRSIDPSGFENVVVNKLLSDYVKYIQNSYKSFEGQDKTERQQWTFSYEIFLINFSLVPRTKENHPREIFTLIKKQLPANLTRMSVTVGSKNEENTSFIKIPVIRKAQQVLINYLQDKGVDFIDQVNLEMKEPEIELKLPKKKALRVTDRKNSILNKGANFKKTNDLIKHFLGRRRVYFINYTKGIDRLEELTKRLEKNKVDDLLNF